MDMVRAIRESVVGRNATYLGPYGPRRLVYADYTASGRLLSFIETYLNVRILSLYSDKFMKSQAWLKKNCSLSLPSLYGRKLYILFTAIRILKSVCAVYRHHISMPKPEVLRSIRYVNARSCHACGLFVQTFLITL